MWDFYNLSLFLQFGYEYFRFTVVYAKLAKKLKPARHTDTDIIMFLQSSFIITGRLTIIFKLTKLNVIF